MSRPGQIRFLSGVARAYDPVVRAMGFRRLWDAMAERAAPGPGVRCLDVCTGTGGVALALARRGARVVGADLATGMLARAQSKAHALGCAERARFVRMDARGLALPSSSFPVVVCAMALHEMAEEERRAVLLEVRRVSSDCALIADYRVPSRAWRRVLFRIAFAFEYLESDDFGGFAAQDLGALLAAVGFRMEVPVDVGPYRIWCCRVAGS